MQSFVMPVGYSAESCGYCKDASSGRQTPNSRSCYYFSSKSLTVEVYQALVDRGWRRSGTVFYKPDVLRHCCPHYTIRLPVTSFTPLKDQRQAVNRWNRYILGDEYIKDAAKLHPKSKDEKIRQRNTFDLLGSIHESEYAHVKHPPEPAHRFEVTLELDEFTLEKYELFKNYQQHVHHEGPSQISQSGFKRFLCNSPLLSSTENINGRTRRLGSYHQCYRLDGRLIAMGVLDLLPHCVSGVYLLYHSDFEKWSFGKLSALREAALALEDGYKYYYMGYYIHYCVKMRYKGDYKPQHVLDPETYAWDPLDGELRQLLDSKEYVSLSRERRLKKEDREDSGNGSAIDVDPKDNIRIDFPLPSAAEAGKAVQRGMSLFDLKVPGLMTVEDIETQVKLDNQAIQIRGFPRIVEAQELVAWRKGDLREPQTLKGIIGELVACVGPEVAPQLVVNFG